MTNYGVMLAEPDQATREIYQRALGTAFNMVLASHAHTVLHALRTQKIMALVLEPMIFGTHRRHMLTEICDVCAEQQIHLVICSTLDERRQGAELGITTYLVKPILPATLLDTLQRVLGVETHRQTPTATGRARANQHIEQPAVAQFAAFEDASLADVQAAAVLEERQRLARDLHDSVTQALYGITLHAEVARRLLASGDVAVAGEYLRTLQNTAQEALAEMRLLIFDLRPPILAQVGLAAALQVRLDAVEGRADLQTELLVDVPAHLPVLVERTLYGIAREALNNTLKHARAQHIAVHVWQKGTSIFLDVRDDGVGFDTSALHVNGGLGLRGITERVAQVKGTLTLHSTPTAGTQLRVEVPL